MKKKYFLADLSASIAVFLVALPLCMGIALASGAPLFSGILSGIVGGVLVGLLSNAQVSVSGPAAGLTLVVLNGIAAMGSFNLFIVSVVLAGVIQLLLGIFKAGYIVDFFPHSVIKGMLSAIGLILILKQIPVAIGWDSGNGGNFGWINLEGTNAYPELLNFLANINPGVVVLSIFSFLVLLLLDTKKVQNSKLRYIPSALAVVFFGILISLFYENFIPNWSLKEDQKVNIPLLQINGISSFFQLPDWLALHSWKTYRLALTIAIIAGIESLLSLEATDKLDPLKRVSNPNQELIAQGIGNTVCGLVGGIPLTAVIVRSSTNISAGGRTRNSSVLHGIWIFLSVVFFSKWLNLIPLASLAVILIFIGFQLVSPTQLIKIWQKGKSQFVPFLITIITILISNILLGVLVGVVSALYFISFKSIKSSIVLIDQGKMHLLKLGKQVSFVSKPYLKWKLKKIPSGAHVVIDTSNALLIDSDIEEVLEDFIQGSANRNISVQMLKS